MTHFFLGYRDKNQKKLLTKATSGYNKRDFLGRMGREAGLTSHRGHARVTSALSVGFDL